MITRIVIDPNIRLANNLTFAGFEDIESGEPVETGMRVYVIEPEANLVGKAVVNEVDEERELIYLKVDWPSLTEPSAEGLHLQDVANISINHSSLTRTGAQDAPLRIGPSSELLSEPSR